jgi:hypothetical protein
LHVYVEHDCNGSQHPREPVGSSSLNS